MCATPDKAATAEFRSRKGRQRAYKVVRKDSARPNIFTRTGVSYRPGRNVDVGAVKTHLGYRRTNKGFHCFLSRRAADAWRDSSCYRLAVVCVTFDPTDVIVAESLRETVFGVQMHRRNRQIVVRALNISKRAWKQAGLPEQARRDGR